MSRTKLNITDLGLTNYQLGNALMRALHHEGIDSALTAMDCERIAARMLAADALYDACADAGRHLPMMCPETCTERDRARNIKGCLAALALADGKGEQ